jgi:hypothetical protein
MNDLFRTLQANKSTKKEEEISLFTSTLKNQMKCNYCKKLGHSEENCWHKNANHNNHNGNYTRSLRPCKHCGGKHFDNKCWELPQNASYRPSNWKTRINHETANINQDVSSDSNVELLLSTVDQEMLTHTEHKNLLTEPSIWIGDTAATVHMTSYANGMTNIKEVRGGITVGNGEIIETKQTGDIPCEICDRNGN